MTNPFRALFFTTAAASAAVVIYLGATLPPATVDLGGALPATEVAGAYHIHTTRSDGSGTIASVAAAAARAGLKFIIVTDHGDATRAPDPPAYRSGVLCIDAVEISSTEGHIVALGLNRPSPYPLAGAAADVIDDIHRMGGKAIVAHPDSPRLDLSWRGSNEAFDGIEWLNVDSEWRDKSTATLAATAVKSLFRSPESIAALFVRPARSLQRWDTSARTRPVFGMAALDAHARIGWGDSDEPRGWLALHAPSYESMFRTLADVAVLDRPLSGHADEDAAAVLSAITAGRVFAIVRAFAEPASIDFTANRGPDVFPMGARLTASPAAVVLHARVSSAPGARLTLLRNGRPVRTAQGQLEYETADSGVYRAEVAWPGQRVPWIMSNPITIAADDAALPPPDEPEPLGTGTIALPSVPEGWHIEHEASSSGTVHADAGQALAFAFGLAPGIPHGQYAALVTDVHSTASADRVLFTARADRPMRLSVQVKLPSGRGETLRWRRSVYVDDVARPYVVPLREFQPADGPRGSWSPNATRVGSVLFVVDTLNTRPGTSGTVWISDASLGMGSIPAPQ